MKKIVFLLLLPAFTSNVLAQSRLSLCTADEQVAFSCHVGRKIASLCASKKLSKTEGYVQYRFGLPAKVEMTYPEQIGVHPSRTFKWGVLGFSGGGTDYYRFSNHGYDYVVYSGFGKGWTQEGVVVEKDGRRLQSLVCKDAALGDENWRVMYSAGIPQIDDSNGFDMPAPRQ